MPSPIRRARGRDGELGSSIVYVDTFGNVKLAGLRSDLEAALGPLVPGDRLALALEGGRARSTIDVAGDVRRRRGRARRSLYEDSYGRVCLAASQANAAELHGLVEDLEVVIRRG